MRNVERPYSAEAFKKDVVVLIPSYNRPQQLKQCLRCLADYTDAAKYDLLIVDDKSPQILEIINCIGPLSSIHSNWEIIEKSENGGFTKTVNYGIKHLWRAKAKYKYILLLNNDATVGPHWLETMVAAFNDSKDVGIVSPFLGVWCPDSIYPTPLGWDRPYSAEGNPIDVRTKMVQELKCDSWYEDHVGFWGAMIRFDLFERYGLFDERFQIICQDLDWSHRIRKYGWRTKVVLTDEGRTHLIWHRGHTHIDLKPRDEIDAKCEEDQRLIREIWPEKYDHDLNKRHWGKN